MAPSARLLAVVAVVVGLAALVWGGWQATGGLPGTDESAQDERVRATASVERRSLEDTVITRGVVGFRATGTATAAGSGRVTAVMVETGTVVEAGEVLLAIGARPMVAAEGLMPFWRELTVGFEGPDVTALQRLLADAGYLASEPDGRFTDATRSALRRWQEEHGFPTVNGVFRPDDVLVGSWPQRVGRVVVGTGDFVQPGSPLVRFVEPDRLVIVDLLPSHRLRVASGAAARVTLAATGTTVTGTVADVAATPISQDAEGIVYPATITLDGELDAPEGTQVRVEIVVDRSEDVTAIPLAALVSDHDGNPAVRVVRVDGTVETVPVLLGLSAGAWVEVTSGLTGSETVLVAGE